MKSRNLLLLLNIYVTFSGNYDGKGKIRKQELWDACKELGVPDHNICLITDSRLPDNPKKQWPVPVVAKLIEHQVEALNIDTLVTFDRGGVSSHPNHAAVFYAVAYMFVEKNMPESKLQSICSINYLAKQNLIVKDNLLITYEKLSLL